MINMPQELFQITYADQQNTKISICATPHKLTNYYQVT